MTKTLKTLVIARTPMFSPYVVVGGPPINEAMIVATLSPLWSGAVPAFNEILSDNFTQHHLVADMF